MAKDSPIFDFESAGVRQMAKRMIDQARGLHRWELVKCRDQRTLSQNAYLWGVVYPHVAAGLAEAWGERSVDPARAHVECGLMFLSEPVVDMRTGEVRPGKVRSTTALNTAECADYIEKIIQFAADYLHMDIPPATRHRPSQLARA